jgi:hypothetical protein
MQNLQNPRFRDEVREAANLEPEPLELTYSITDIPIRADMSIRTLLMGAGSGWAMYRYH